MKTEKEIKDTNLENDTPISDHLMQLPQRVVDFYEIKEGDIANISLESSNIIVSFPESKKRDIIPQKSFLIPAFVASILFIIYNLYNSQRLIPLVGNMSTATFIMSIGLISGMINFTYFFFKSKKGVIQINTKLISMRTYPTIVISFTIILFFILLVFFRFIGYLFDGIEFDIWTSAFINFVFVALINFAMVNIAFTLTTKTILNALMYTIIGGVMIAMATNSELQWWQYNFSFLGTPEANNSWNFNITLIFSALLMIALVDFQFVNLGQVVEPTKKLLALRILLILTAVSLAGVGLFPYNDNPIFQAIHNRTAENLVYLIIILIIAVRWLLPNVSKDFLKLSYIIGATLFVLNILFQGIGYLSLTAFELFAFIFAFTWLFLLFQEIEREIQTSDTRFTVQITKENKVKPL